VLFFLAPHKEKRIPSTLEQLEHLDLGTDLAHIVNGGPNALLLDLARFARGKLLLASLGRPSVCREIKVPVLEDEDLDKVKENKVEEGDADDANAPNPTDGLADNDTVDADQHCKDLGSHDCNKENRRREVLPEVARETGRENDEMRCRRDVKIYDGLELCFGDMENISGDKEGGKSQGGQEGAENDGQENQLTNSPLVGMGRDLGIVNRNNQGGGVVQDSNQNEQNRLHSPLEGHGDAKEEHQEVDSRRDSVQGIGSHALENCTGSHQPVYNR